MLKEDYTPFQKKYDLPSFEELEKHFDLLQIEDELLLNSLRKNIQERLEFLSDILCDILQPSPESLQQMHEIEHVSEEQKQTTVKLYKKVFFLLRLIHESILRNDEKFTAKIIKDITDKYPDLKKQALPILISLKESWTKEIVTKQTFGYFG